MDSEVIYNELLILLGQFDGAMFLSQVDWSTLELIVKAHNVFLVDVIPNFPKMHIQEKLVHFHYLHHFVLVKYYNPDMLNSQLYLVPLNPAKKMPDHLLYCNDICYAIQNKFMVNHYGFNTYICTQNDYVKSTDLITVSGFYEARHFNPLMDPNYIKAISLRPNSKFFFNDLSYMFEIAKGQKIYIENLYKEYADWYIANSSYHKEGLEYIKNKNNLNIHNWNKTQNLKSLLNMKNNNIPSYSLKQSVNLVKTIKF